ncbi:protein kinase [Endozoicomonas sp. ONNA2]|uniref:protein kinase domain-containing protein n=1 Tax=Endozoicomonas sp. ONNA2 TaxID=2828741 RepID=UPI0021481E71|nr:protein kinase [Endozoicomonas sp. ONNA2]
MTKRRVEVLMQKVQEGKNTSDHVDTILGLPDEIQTECSFINKAQFKKLIESDAKVYLSHEIKLCKSGDSLVALKQEVNRLRVGNKVSGKVIDSLNKEIHHQMAVLVKTMPKHLRSIPYKKEPGIDFLVTENKCNAINNLLTAAKNIDGNLVRIHRKALNDMMIDVFSRDVREITYMCLARNNPIGMQLLSMEIESLRKKTIKPFLYQVSSFSEHYYQVKTNTEKALRMLEAKRITAHHPENNLKNKVGRSFAEKWKTQTPYIERKFHSNGVLPPQPALPVTFKADPITKLYNLPIVPEEDLICEENLGKGSFGSVELVKHKQTNQYLALKKVANVTHRRNECALMIIIQRAVARTGGNTENIIQIVAMSRGRSDKKYALMEYGGKNLKKSSKQNGCFKGEKLKRTFYQTVKGVNTLFKVGYQHQDIKPENILINDEGVVKICDFGLALRIGGCRQVRDGSLKYMSPEKLYRLDYEPNDRADSWALGCTFAELCLDCKSIMPVDMDMFKGKLPYKAAIDKINKKRKDVYEQLLEKEGKQAADLFWALTEPDPKKRLSPTEALAHPYFDSCHS